jgi:cyclomaltodextrin glucanotransferase
MPEESDLESELDMLAGSDTEFRSQTIYFLVVDRFNCGNPGKGREDDPMFDPTQEDWGKYWGGDLQGIIDKLDYLQGMNITAIWTTPLFEQVQAMTVGEDPKAPIHGYWTSDFKRINPRWCNDPSEKRLFLRDDTTFDKLLAALHAGQMRFVLDIVCNHSSPATAQGKGKLYDDGKLVADFENDDQNWYHHYGDVTDWDDEWQVQNCELAGLATFNENNILYRNHIKDAIKLWIGKGVDALRIDTVKHMPLWFWQEFCSDISIANPNVFRFGEWIHSRPDNPKSVEFANKSGMTLLDFGFCDAVREVLSGRREEGFAHFQSVLDQDGNYCGATELVTFFENHDMPRLQSLGASNETMDLALVLLLTSRGVPCIYYGCEQYLHNDTDGGHDPYNRSMMDSWETTNATRIIGILARLRRLNLAIQIGGQWPALVDPTVYVYLRRYRDSRCLVLLNRGDSDREVDLFNLDYPEGKHRCLLTGTEIQVSDGNLAVTIPACTGLVFARRGRRLRGRVVIRVQLNGAPTRLGDRVLIIGDCEELGKWDIREGIEMECVNANIWFGEIAFNANAGKTIGYKFVILPGSDPAPHRENCVVRRRLVIPEGFAKWRDRWEE